MWTTSELKARARGKLKKYFWDALVISIILGLFSSSGGTVARSRYEFNRADSVNGTSLYSGVEVGANHSPELFHEIMDAAGHMPDTLGSMFTGENMLLLSVLASILLISLVIGIVIGIFVKPALEVGKNRFYVESSIVEGSAGISKIAWGFKNHYLNITWVMFLKNLIVVLGYICCLIPGIYFAYCFAMVPYVLAENPDMRARDALRLSNEMMRGNKFGMFTMELSFIGWVFLGSLVGMFTCGLGSFLVMPYIEATHAELYQELRQPFTGMLNGFGYRSGGYDAHGSYGTYGPQGPQGPQDPYGNPGYGPQGPQDPYGNPGYGPQGPQDPYNNPWNQSGPADFHEEPQTPPQPDIQAERGGEVKRSEGGPGRGYYLNGVFFPYTEDELRELENYKK